MATRAYTLLDRAHVAVGNQWFERRWSAFLGNTVNLWQKRPSMEWLNGSSSEFAVTVNGQYLGLTDFGQIDWSEENSPYGAALVVQRSRPGLQLTCRTLAFHENPGMLRSMRMLNTSGETLELQRVTAERLPLGRPGLQVRTHSFRQVHQAIEWRAEELAAAVVLPDRGLILGQEGGGLFQLLAPETGVCALSPEVDRRLGPGERLDLPSSFVIPYGGDLDSAATIYGDFLRLWREIRRVTPKE